MSLRQEPRAESSTPPDPTSNAIHPATIAQDFGQILDVDAESCFNLLQPSIAPLRETRGTILAVSTPAVRRYAKKDLLASALKSVIEAMVRGIAVEEGRYGLRSNCIQVGLLQGESMWDRLIESGEYSPELLDVAKSNIA